MHDMVKHFRFLKGYTTDKSLRIRGESFCVLDTLFYDALLCRGKYLATNVYLVGEMLQPSGIKHYLSPINETKGWRRNLM